MNNLGANLHEEAFRLCPVTGSATRMHGVWTADSTRLPVAPHSASAASPTLLPQIWLPPMKRTNGISSSRPSFSGLAAVPPQHGRRSTLPLLQSDPDRILCLIIAVAPATLRQNLYESVAVCILTCKQACRVNVSYADPDSIRSCPSPIFLGALEKPWSFGSDAGASCLDNLG